MNVPQDRALAECLYMLARIARRPGGGICQPDAKIIIEELFERLDVTENDVCSAIDLLREEPTSSDYWAFIKDVAKRVALRPAWQKGAIDRRGQIK